MRTAFMLLLLCLVVIGGSPQARPDLLAADRHSVQIVVSVQLTVQDPQTGTWILWEALPELVDCSGFPVAYHGHLIILTAKHCVTAQTSLGLPEGNERSLPTVRAVRFYDRSRRLVRAVQLDPRYDLAFLDLGPSPSAGVQLQPRFSQGEELFVIGAMDQFDWVYSRATAMQGPVFHTIQTEAVQEQQVALMDCPSCFHGDSGAPVFNLDGEVVGMAVALSERATAEFLPAAILQQELVQELLF